MKKDLFQLFRFNIVKALFTGTLFFCVNDLRAQTIFKDDFNRAMLGNAWHTEYWSIVNGSAFNGLGGPLITTASYGDSSYVIETAAMGFTSDYYREFRITFGQAEDQVREDYHRTYVLMYTRYFGSRLTLGKSTDNVFYPDVLDQAAIYPALNDTKWYKFKVARYKSGLIQVYLVSGTGYSATPLLEAIDSTYQTLGHFGWREDTQTAEVGFYVDYIGADKPSTEKPAIREKPVEDNLISQAFANSGRTYNITKLNTGVKAYTDREYTVTSLPPWLNGASFVQTAMDDKFNTADEFLTLVLKRHVVLYVSYDPRATSIPAWLSNFVKTGDVIGTTDTGSSSLDVYSRVTEFNDIFPFPLRIGANLAHPADGAKMNYLVAAVAQPDHTRLEAEDALLSGAVRANNHPGYTGSGFVDYKNALNDYIEWTVNISVPGDYYVNFYYANAGITDRPLQISADGTDLSILPFSPGFGNPTWSSWRSRGLDIFLTRGIHKIRATATGSGGPNMDAMSLSYSSALTFAAAGKPPVTGNQFTGTSFDNSLKVFPNPFAESVKIRYTLKQKTHVVLSVYSLQGQQLQLLVNGTREKGTYQADFNAGKFAAGIYFYRLQTGNEIKTGKLLKK